MSVEQLCALRCRWRKKGGFRQGIAQLLEGEYRLRLAMIALSQKIKMQIRPLQKSEHMSLTKTVS